MVNARQRTEIQRRLRRIKDAKEEGDIQLVRKRASRLHDYLEKEGLTRPLDDKV